jgi:hypothetical protein
MKDLLIGNLTGYTPDKIDNWVQSAKAHFTGEILILGYNLPQSTLDYLKDNNIKVVLTQSLGFHIVVQRFLDIYTYLTQNPNYGYVIITDVKDVIFQSNPVKFLEDRIVRYKKILVGSEGLKYKDENWGNNNLATCYPHLYDLNKDNEIYNAGTFAGLADYIRGLCFQIFHLSLVGTQNDPQPDQAAFNILINLPPWDDIVYYCSMEENWCAQLGTTLDPKVKDKYASKLLTKSPIVKENKVYTHEGELYCLVHQYDRIPGLDIKYL